MENIGEKYNLEKFLMAREKTIGMTREIASSVRAGMSENDGQEIIKQTFIKNNIERLWHPSKFRIGKNTLKSFGEMSDSKVVLQPNDIFFLDLGPVVDGHEGDYGETFSLGSSENFSEIIFSSKKIFKEVARVWRSEGLTGVELYKHASDFSQKMGYVLNLKMDGHRLSDYPHAIHFKGSLSEVQIIPKPNLWVLEILIRHSHLPFGAFAEDLLY